MTNNTKISIITLIKDDLLKFSRTLKSIKQQKIDFKIEWLIIDGSEIENQKKIEILIEKNFKKDIQSFIKIRHINSISLEIYGIYRCMNYGKYLSKGQFIIFLNSGDEFFNKKSLQILFDHSHKANTNLSIVFGQANIIYKNNLSWNFPGPKLNNIKNWLKFFEPNHQAMIISNKLASEFDFLLEYNLVADGYWKRKILKNALDIIYINKPVVRFFLDGISSTRPSKKTLKSILRNQKITFFRKLIFTIKFILPSRLFYFYSLIQKYKSYLFDLIF
tara:strand:+ start:5364 stop:6191 length:828 start_codon:yes stop_codon:yes gene_type:complete